MNLRKTFVAFVVMMAWGMVQQAPATIYSDTLADLVNSHGSLTIGDKTFSGFSYLANGMTAFDANNILVTASQSSDGVYHLTWSGQVAFLVSAGPAVADLLLSYTVTANPGQIIGIDQSYVGSGQPASGSFLAVDESVYAGANVVAYSHLERGDMSDPPAETIQGDQLIINPPQSTLTVVKDISFAINAPTGGFVTISQVEQSFEQAAVPEPTTVVAGILLLLPLGASTLKILRTKKIV
ncbi:MAG TPA: hypothetical protein VMB80_11100 [Candidatus Acidoferrum sp.]|nr:hypothetical protein [Candidatus Acidoferrum sp.]